MLPGIFIERNMYLSYSLVRENIVFTKIALNALIRFYR